jgi:hypothetical protein
LLGLAEQPRNYKDYPKAPISHRGFRFVIRAFGAEWVYSVASNVFRPSQHSPHEVLALVILARLVPETKKIKTDPLPKCHFTFQAVTRNSDTAHIEI